MELTQGSETSANYNLTPGKYPKEYIQQSHIYIYIYIYISSLQSNIDLLTSTKMELTNIIYSQQKYIMLQHHSYRNIKSYEN